MTEANATVKAKVSMAMAVRRADGTVEEHGEQFQKVVELDYDQAVALLGREQADTVFNRQGGTDGNSEHSG